MPSLPTVFLSYSHKDAGWKDGLVLHLRALALSNLLKVWVDDYIEPGDLWKEKIYNSIDTARVAVLLISENFLASDFIRREELPRLQKRWVEGRLQVIPVICSTSTWKHDSWLSKLQACPHEGNPLDLVDKKQINIELAHVAEQVLNCVIRNETSSRPLPSLGEFLAARHQLPSPPADFLGRDREIAEIGSALVQNGTVKLVGLHGMGGIGKTALALKLGAEFNASYPDAQIYFDLKSLEVQSITATHAMEHVIRSFHPEVQLPRDDNELKTMYLAVLHGKRTFILMENASREQTVNLIPNAESVLVVTSRINFTLPGMSNWVIEELSDIESRKLIKHITQRIMPALRNDDIDHLAELCCGLPLALELAGGVLAETPSLSPSQLIRCLKEDKSPEAFRAVRASLDISYNFISEEQRRFWRLLSVFYGNFNEQAAAAIWVLNIDEARRTLWEFSRQNLVKWSKEDERYLLHDIVRQFVEEKLDPTEKLEARKRHAKYFLDVLRAANSIFVDRDSRLGIELFDAEWPNILAGQIWAAACFAKQIDDPEIARICSDYPQFGLDCLDLRQNPRDRIAWREVALKAAVYLNDSKAESAHLGNLGLAYADLGDLELAVEYYERQLTIDRRLEDLKGESQAIGNLGTALLAAGETSMAIMNFKKQLEIAQSIDDFRGKGNALGSLGTAYRLQDQPDDDEAIKCYEEALHIFREIHDRRGEGKILDSLGNVYLSLADYINAGFYYQECLNIAKDIGDQESLSIASWHLGRIYEKNEDINSALDLMKILVDYERELGHPDLEKHAAYVESLRARLAAQNSDPEK